MAKKNAPLSQLRIIGGKWRGRKIHFLDLPHIRPTGDRIRETLFNWLAPYINGSNCLDCFAGSGALGFEALSRGADFVSFIDQDPGVIQQLNIVNDQLDNTKAEIITATIPNNIPLAKANYDIVFLDPPFDSDLIKSSLAWLQTNNFLAENALIYIELAKEDNLTLHLPANFPIKIIKENVTGNVHYLLVKKATT